MLRSRDYRSFDRPRKDQSILHQWEPRLGERYRRVSLLSLVWGLRCGIRLSLSMCMGLRIARMWIRFLDHGIRRHLILRHRMLSWSVSLGQRRRDGTYQCPPEQLPTRQLNSTCWNLHLCRRSKRTKDLQASEEVCCILSSARERKWLNVCNGNDGSQSKKYEQMPRQKFDRDEKAEWRLLIIPCPTRMKSKDAANTWAIEYYIHREASSAEQRTFR